MRGYIPHNADCSVVGDWIEVASPTQLPPPDEGMVWTEVPFPPCGYTVVLGSESGAPLVVPYVPSPERQLQAAKADRWALAKAHRERVAAGGCATPLGRIDSDSESRQKISGAVQMAMIASAAGEPFEIAWTMSDNQVVLHDAAATIAMGVTAGRFIDGCQQAGTAIRAAIEAAPDTVAVAAIDITAGYPATPGALT